MYIHFIPSSYFLGTEMTFAGSFHTSDIHWGLLAQSAMSRVFTQFITQENFIVFTDHESSKSYII
jgi:hypothetical protein